MQEGDSQTPIEKWSEYVERYDTTENTKGEEASLANKAPVISNRSKGAAGFGDDLGKAMDGVVLHNELECKICVNTYKIKFLAKGHDVFYRKTKAMGGGAPAATKSVDSKSVDNIFKEWMDKNVNETDIQKHADWWAGREEVGDEHADGAAQVNTAPRTLQSCNLASWCAVATLLNHTKHRDLRCDLHPSTLQCWVQNTPLIRDF